MKPITGISKNLDKEFLVGIALPFITEPNTSKREQANEKFIREARGRVERAMLNYFFSHGILVTTGTMYRLNEETLGGISEPIESIEQNIKTIGDAVRMFNDTGGITQPTKEKMMRNVYEIERVLSKNSGSSNIKNRVNSLREARSVKHKDVSVAALLMVCLGVILSYSSSMWWPSLAGIVVGAAIQILHKRNAIADREQRFIQRMAVINKQIVGRSVNLDDYIAGRV